MMGVIKRYSLLSAILLFAHAAPHYGSAQEVSNDSTSANSGVVYGQDHAFILTAPSGWLLDNSSGVSQGLHAVFYPKGSTWEKGTAVMYANTAHKSVQGNETIKKLIAFDTGRFKSQSSQTTVSQADTILTGDKKKAIVKHISDAKHKNYEAVAYIDESKTVVILVLTSRTLKEFEISLPKFTELVSSYRFLSEQVIIENKE